LEVLQHAATIGKGFEETLQGLRRHFSSLAHVVIIISDFEEEE